MVILAPAESFEAMNWLFWPSLDPTQPSPETAYISQTRKDKKYT